MKKITAFIISILLAGSVSSGQETRFSSSEIRNLEKQGLIIRERADAWKTREGLIISGYDNDGSTRLEHILKHLSDVKGKNTHGVFTVRSDKVIIMMDKIWIEVKNGKLEPSATGARYVYIYDTGKKVGYLGGRRGASKGYPELKKVRLVLEGKTPRVVTFYPI